MYRKYLNDISITSNSQTYLSFNPLENIYPIYNEQNINIKFKQRVFIPPTKYEYDIHISE